MNYTSIRNVTLATLVWSAFAMGGCSADGASGQVPNAEFGEHAAFARGESVEARDVGVTRWKVSQTKAAVSIEAIDAQGRVTAAFQLTRGIRSMKLQVVGTTRSLVLGFDGHRISNTLNANDRALLIAASKDIDDGRGDRLQMAYRWWDDFVKAATAALACAVAAGEAGANPAADAACAIAVVDVVGSSTDDD